MPYTTWFEAIAQEAPDAWDALWVQLERALPKPEVRRAHLGGLRDDDGRSLATYAAERGGLQFINRLFGAGVPVHGLDDHGNTALHAAACYGQLETLKHLLALKSMAVDIKNFYGQTPAHLAALNGHKHVVMAMMERGLRMPAQESDWPEQILDKELTKSEVQGANGLLKSCALDVAIEELESSSDKNHNNLAVELKCGVLLTPFGDGLQMPVALPVRAGKAPCIVSAQAADNLCVGLLDVRDLGGRARLPPANPFNRDLLDEAGCRAFPWSAARLQGDPGRMAKVEAVRATYLAGGPVEGRCERALLAGDAAEEAAELAASASRTHSKGASDFRAVMAAAAREPQQAATAPSANPPRAPRH